MLCYEKGTITLSPKGLGSSSDELLAALGFVSDPRTGQIRARAHRYPQIAQFLNEKVTSDACSSNIEGLFLPSPKVLPELDARPYQQAAFMEWQSASRNGIVCLPTGSGKTKLALLAIKHCAAPALCLVPTRVLLHQWCKVFAEAGVADVGLFGDGSHVVRPITVATYESAYRAAAALGPLFRLVIIDEAHHFGVGLRDEILEMSTAPWRLGLTATPPPEQSPAALKLADIVGPVVFSLSLADLTGTYLSDFSLHPLQVALNSTERAEHDQAVDIYRTFRARFVTGSGPIDWAAFTRVASRTSEGRRALRAMRRAREITALAAAKRRMLGSLLHFHRNDRTLIFTSGASHAYTFSREFLLPAVTADIKVEERKRIVEGFRDGSYPAIVSCRVLNEGFDVPDANVGIIVGGSQGEREHLQRVGRVLRPKPGKKAIIYDLFCRNTVEEWQERRRQAALDGTSLDRSC